MDIEMDREVNPHAVDAVGTERDQRVGTDQSVHMVMRLVMMSVAGDRGGIIVIRLGRDIVTIIGTKIGIGKETEVKAPFQDLLEGEAVSVALDQGVVTGGGMSGRGVCLLTVEALQGLDIATVEVLEDVVEVEVLSDVMRRQKEGVGIGVSTQMKEIKATSKKDGGKGGLD